MRTNVHPVRYVVLIVLFVISSTRLTAQSISTGDGKFELGLGLGPSFFLGDLGGNRGIGKTFVKDVNIPFTKLCKGLYFNYSPAEFISLRIAGNLGGLEANDSIIKTNGINELERKKRDLSFRSKLAEVYGAIEFYPTVFFEQYDGLAHKLRPYGLIGFGIFHFNPQAEYIEPNGTRRWVDLKPLHLEGQGFPEYPDRKDYSLTQQELLVGFGAKYYLRENMYIGLEILHRKTFTDYVDNVSTKYIDPNLFNLHLSPADAVVARQLAYREKFYNPSVNRPYINQQRGDPKQNDAFFSGMLRIGWRLNGANDPNTRARRQLRCPVFY